MCVVVSFIEANVKMKEDDKKTVARCIFGWKWGVFEPNLPGDGGRHLERSAPVLAQLAGLPSHAGGVAVGDLAPVVEVVAVHVIAGNHRTAHAGNGVVARLLGLGFCLGVIERDGGRHCVCVCESTIVCHVYFIFTSFLFFLFITSASASCSIGRCGLGTS